MTDTEIEILEVKGMLPKNLSLWLNTKTKEIGDEELEAREKQPACADCGKAYADCKCKYYMSESYGGNQKDHIAFLRSQRPPTKGDKR